MMQTEETDSLLSKKQVTFINTGWDDVRLAIKRHRKRVKDQAKRQGLGLLIVRYLLVIKLPKRYENNLA